ncbi:hypothetical protein, partial [Streptomyces sp. NPDC003487]
HLKAAAERMGCGDTFHMAPVGVFFGDGQDADARARADGLAVPLFALTAATPPRPLNDAAHAFLGPAADWD